ncbi:nuclear polyadenylated RNA-binding protein [Parasponia andersonii]|uniref:Nuclear polyadenylated RNA-binding protein n=1 Tax=Parasponia andersonii TaxID=3476 RepID=A0A2P5CSZ9_PARAD|nr:nuclear polyadenylated RNA-binding protein [Parasponia andersonii]
MLSGYLENFLMRVLLCKIHCPSFICFCKPSPHIYTPGPLNLENTPHAPPKTSDQILGENKVKEEILDGKQQQQQQQLAENSLKSNLRKPNSDPHSPKEKEKKRVQWMDLLGKELVEIREFESRIPIIELLCLGYNSFTISSHLQEFYTDAFSFCKNSPYF